MVLKSLPELSELSMPSLETTNVMSSEENDVLLMLLSPNKEELLNIAVLNGPKVVT